MSKYLIKFEKNGLLRYISHLDLMRLFQRTFKRADIRLSYSKGFNPHPKMSIAQPLSLGFTGGGEYMEFETVEEYTAEDLSDKLNRLFPAGISILKCRLLDENRKNAAALVGMGSYKIGWKTKPLAEAADVLDQFCHLKEIFVEKAQKKTKMLKQIDIQSMIKSAEYLGRRDNKEWFRVFLAAGSEANLNPELFMKAFSDFIERDFSKEDLRIHREGLYLNDGTPLIES